MTLWGGALAGLLAVPVLAWAMHHLLSAEERRRFPPPGQLLDIGGRKLHLYASGEGTPTVVLESALAGTSLSWGPVQQILAQRSRVVSADRGGFGWSDPASAPRRVDVLVDELRRGLEAAQMEPPYLLVGHSYGGFVARLFAARYPLEVAGLVLVDVPHPREWMIPSANGARRIARSVRLSRGAALLAHFGIIRAVYRLAGRGMVLGGSAPGEQGRIAELLGKVEAPLRETLRSFWVRPPTLEALASLIENVPASAALVDSSSRDLGSLPLRVLTASDPSPERMREQEEVVRLSSRGRHVVAQRSGHWIPLEEPSLVVEAIGSVLDEIRSGAPGSAGGPDRPSSSVSSAGREDGPESTGPRAPPEVMPDPFSGRR